MVRDMERSLSKFLYEFLPENTFNHANIQISGRVKSVSAHYSDGEEATLNAPHSYVINRVKQHFYRWPNSEDLLSDNLYANVDITVPGYAQYHTYPRTFECPQCRMFIRFRSEDERNFHERDTEELFSCANCNTRIGVADQLPFVAICECGEMTELWAPTHQHNGQELNMRLSRPTTRMFDWEWQCVHSGCNESLPFVAYSVSCPDPACPNDDLRITNHTDSEVFYPQTKDFINLQEDLENIDNTLYRAKVVSDYILNDELQKPSESEIKQKAAEILGGFEEFVQANKEEEERAREQARAALTQDRQEHRQQIAGWLDNHPQYSERQKVALTEECHEYLSLTRSQDYEPSSDFRAFSFEEMGVHPAETHLDEATIEHYHNLRDQLNIRNIHLIEDIPITTVTYGYTRIDSEADEADAPAIEQTLDEQSAQRNNQGGETDNAEDEADGETEVPVQLNIFTTRTDPYPTFYAQENKAEGILIELNPELVLDWLVENGVITSENRPSEEDARMWFVDAVMEPSRYERLTDDEHQAHLRQDNGQAISRHVYSLLNSYAHAFINTIGMLGGVQRESLVERVLPHTLSFVVYKSPDTDQSFGTIQSLFEERFDEFVTQFEEQERCPLNKVCYADENGACEHCLYLPALSTQNTNHNLSRATMFGGPFDAGKLSGNSEDIDGFLSL